MLMLARHLLCRSALLCSCSMHDSLAHHCSLSSSPKTSRSSVRHAQGRIMTMSNVSNSITVGWQVGDARKQSHLVSVDARQLLCEARLCCAACFLQLVLLRQHGFRHAWVHSPAMRIWSRDPILSYLNRQDVDVVRVKEASEAPVLQLKVAHRAGLQREARPPFRNPDASWYR